MTISFELIMHDPTGLYSDCLGAASLLHLPVREVPTSSFRGVCLYLIRQQELATFRSGFEICDNLTMTSRSRVRCDILSKRH